MPESLDLAAIKIDRFEPLVSEVFLARPLEVLTSQSSFELELVRIISQPLGSQEGRRTPFSLFFDGPVGAVVEQGLYNVRHPQTGDMLLFLVPVAQENDRLQLQAVFN